MIFTSEDGSNKRVLFPGNENTAFSKMKVWEIITFSNPCILEAVHSMRSLKTVLLAF